MLILGADEPPTIPGDLDVDGCPAPLTACRLAVHNAAQLRARDIDTFLTLSRPREFGCSAAAQSLLNKGICARSATGLRGFGFEVPRPTEIALELPETISTFEFRLRLGEVSARIQGALKEASADNGTGAARVLALTCNVLADLTGCELGGFSVSWIEEQDGVASRVLAYFSVTNFGVSGMAVYEDKAAFLEFLAGGATLRNGGQTVRIWSPPEGQ